MNIKARRGGLIAILCALGCLTSSASALRRYNLFDPLFADDDSDAHTVSAGSHTSNNDDYTNKKVLEISNANARVSGQRLPPAIGDDDDASFYSTSGPTSSTSKVIITSNLPKRIESSTGGWSMRNPSPNNLKRHLSLASSANNQLDQTATSASRARQTEKPEHWSALTSYYEKLRKQGGSVTGQLANYPNTYPEIYQNEQKIIDEMLSRPHQPIYKGDGAKAAPSFETRQPPFLQPDVIIKSAPWSFPWTSDVQDYYLRQQQQQQQPQQQPKYTEFLNGSKVPYYTDHIVSINVPKQVTNGPGTKTGAGQLQQQTSQQPIEVQYSLRPPILQYSPSPQHHYPIEQIPIEIVLPHTTTLSDTSSNPRVIDIHSSQQLKNLAELLYNRQQENRIKHQLDILGPAVDQRRFQEQIRQENYCGPRNRVFNFDLTRLAPLVEVTAGADSSSLTSAKLSQLMASPAPGEYPSHMGLYNGSSPDDNNFLCAATWIHERFAITLASCIPRKIALNKDPVLTIRAGEWNSLNSSSAMNGSNQSSGTQALRQPSSFVRRIKDVHPFPRYQANSSEHNLALVEWDEAKDYLTNYSFISPACALQARQALPSTRTCWSPVRNITLTEYFDADGEGETKLKRNVGVQEIPIKLLNDDAECKRETQVDLYNFQHPNYICSTDVKRANWRAKLNHTDSFGSGIYCNEGGRLSLVSIVHPVHLDSPSQFGYVDLTYYKPWIQGVIASRSNI